MSHDIIEKFSTHLKNVLTRALCLVVEKNQGTVRPEHLLWALGTEKGAIGAEVLHKLQVKPERLRLLADRMPVDRHGGPAVGSPLLSDSAKRALEKAVFTANVYEHRYVGTEHLLSGLLQSGDAGVEAFFAAEHIELDVLREQVAIVLKSASKFPEMAEMMTDITPASGAKETDAPEEPTKTPALDFFGRDLTHESMQAKLDPVIGREKEIDRVTEILCRRTKNNPLLLGEPGVGKTAIVEGLAKRMFEGRVPEALAGKRLISLDLALVIAGTMYRGEFEARLRQIVEETKKTGNVILFIDEIHQIVGAGSAAGSLDAANILKPALARGEIRCIGATTPAEFKKHVETDAALERRFQTVQVLEPDAATALDVLRGVASQYESYHHVRFSPAALESAVRLSMRFLTDRRLPDKALDLIDEAAASVRVHREVPGPVEERRTLERRLAEIQAQKRQAVAEEQFLHAIELKEEEERVTELLGRLKASTGPEEANIISERDIAQVVSRTVGIPFEDIAEEEQSRLLELEPDIRKHIVGQDDAVRAVADALRRAKVGLSHPNRPLASFLFVGPSGVGKTELAKAMAHAFFHDPKALIRLDMSEYAEGFSASKLVGAPAGYVGYRDTATLSDRVKQRPYAIVLFDELEKAHRDVQNLLLQILEEGELRDATGRVVSFRQTIIVATSNVGLERFTSGGIGFSSSEDERFASLSGDVRKELESRFRPELVNRLDRTLVFRPLPHTHLESIAIKQLDDLQARLAAKGTRLKYEKALPATIAKKADPALGARDIRRILQSEVEPALADLLACGPLPTVTIGTQKDGSLHVWTNKRKHNEKAS